MVIFQWWTPDVRPDNSMDEYWDSMIYVEDLELAKTSIFKSNIFQLREDWNEYKVIQQLDVVLRVKEKCLKPVSDEGFYLEDKVEVIQTKENSHKVGTIESMGYHHKRKKIIYWLSDLNNKRIKKQYFSEDLIKK